MPGIERHPEAHVKEGPETDEHARPHTCGLSAKLSLEADRSAASQCDPHPNPECCGRGLIEVHTRILTSRRADGQIGDEA
jgi:hypothetical protein